jgi:hypothetical protein
MFQMQHLCYDKLRILLDIMLCQLMHGMNTIKYLQHFDWEPQNGKTRGAPRHKWLANIKISVYEVDFGAVDCIKLGQNPVKL